MKRVLIFSLAYIPHVGGAEIALKENTDRMPDIEFHMLTLNFGGETPTEKIGNITVHRIGNGSSYFSKILFAPRAAFAAQNLNRTLQFDAFWAVMSYMLFPIILLRFMGLRVPYILTLQEGDPWEHMFSRWFIVPFRPLIYFGFRNASKIQAISMHLAVWAKRMGSLCHVEVIPNGFDVFWFNTNLSGQDRASFWSNHQSVNSNDAILITTSRLVKKNAIDTVIQALPLLTNVSFVILGEGKEDVALKMLAIRLGVADRVYFFGSVNNSTVIQYLHSSDIFIRPSRSEGMGNSFIEAMAAGLPVIATQEGGIADFLFDAKRNPDKETTGWAVDVDSPEQIAEVVQDILAHPEQVARVRANALALVKEKYDWNLIATQMRALFATLGI
jgi:glycosyltransferase involved in cell wall biosynthesis